MPLAKFTHPSITSSSSSSTTTTTNNNDHQPTATRHGAATLIQTLPVESDITVLAAFPDELLFPGEERPTAAGLEPPATSAEAGSA